LIDNGYGFLIWEQKKRNNSWIFWEKYEEKLNNFNF
jgi:hypothetical protein